MAVAASLATTAMGTHAAAEAMPSAPSTPRSSTVAGDKHERTVLMTRFA